MKAVYIILGMMIGLATGYASASTTNSPAGQDIGWFKKTFSDMSWVEIMNVVESPKDISRRVKTRVDYKADVRDEMKSGESTWNDRAGDCEDFAECVVELCKAKGFDAWVEVYYQENSSQAHAVAMGRWNGRLWISSNGEFQFVDDESKANRVVAREMGWNRNIVHSEAYDLIIARNNVLVSMGR